MEWKNRIGGEVHANTLEEKEKCRGSEEGGKWCEAEHAAAPLQGDAESKLGESVAKTTPGKKTQRFGVKKRGGEKKKPLGGMRGSSQEAMTEVNQCCHLGVVGYQHCGMQMKSKIPLSRICRTETKGGTHAEMITKN